MLRNKILRASGGAVEPSVFVDSGTTESTGNTTLYSVSVPCNFTAGDYLIAFVFAHNATNVGTIEYTFIGDLAINGTTPTSNDLDAAGGRSDINGLGFAVQAASSGSTVTVDVEYAVAVEQVVVHVVSVTPSQAVIYDTSKQFISTTFPNSEALTIIPEETIAVGMAFFTDTGTSTFSVTADQGTPTIRESVTNTSDDIASRVFTVDPDEITTGTSVTFTYDSTSTPSGSRAGMLLFSV